MLSTHLGIQREECSDTILLIVALLRLSERSANSSVRSSAACAAPPAHSTAKSLEASGAGRNRFDALAGDIAEKFAELRPSQRFQDAGKQRPDILRQLLCIVGIVEPTRDPSDHVDPEELFMRHSRAQKVVGDEAA